MRTLLFIAVTALATNVAALRTHQSGTTDDVNVQLERGIQFDFYPATDSYMDIEVSEELGIVCSIEKSRKHHAVSCNYLAPEKYGQIAWFWRSPPEWYPLNLEDSSALQFRNTNDGRGIVLIVKTQDHLVFLNGTFGWFMHRVPRNAGFVHNLEECPIVNGNLYWIEGDSPDSGNGAKEHTHLRIFTIHDGGYQSVPLPISQVYYCEGKESEERCVVNYQWQQSNPGMILLSNQTVTTMWNAVTQQTLWAIDAGAGDPCLQGDALMFSYGHFVYKIFKVSDIPSGSSTSNPASIPYKYRADLSTVTDDSNGFNGCKYLDIDLDSAKLSILWWYTHRYPKSGPNAYSKSDNYYFTYDLQAGSVVTKTLFSTSNAILCVNNGSNSWGLWTGDRYQVVTFPGFNVLNNNTLPFHFNKESTESPASVVFLSKGSQLVNIEEGDSTNPAMYITDFQTNRVYFHKELNSRYEGGAVTAILPNNRFAMLSANASTIEIYKY